MVATQRDPRGVQFLEDLEVFGSLDPDAVIGKDGIFSSAWESMGVLDEGSFKYDLTRTLDKEEVKGGGYGVTARKYKPGEVSGKVSVIERNKLIEHIQWPDTHIVDGVKLRRHSSKVAEVVVAVVRKNTDGSADIAVSREPAQCTMEDIGFNETPEGKEISISYIPDASKVILEEYHVTANGEIMPLNLVPKRFVEAGEVSENDPTSYKFTLGSPTGGTFTVKAGPMVAKGLPHNADAAAIQKALRAAGDKDIEVTGDASAGFVVAKGNGPVEVDGAKLTGGGYPKDVAVKPA